MNNLLITNEDFEANKNKYLITEETYKKYEVQFCTRLKPRNILIIPIVLPFDIEINGVVEYCGFSQYGNHGYLFKFKSIQEWHRFEEDLFFFRAMNKNRYTHLTYVEMAIISNDVLNVENSDNCISMLLQDLNTMLIGCSFMSYNPLIQPVSRQMLWPDTAFRLIDLDNWKNDNIFMLSLNMKTFERQIDDYRPFDDSEFWNHVDYFTKLNFNSSSTNPFLISELFAFNALNSYYNGLHKEVVININTCIESFIKNLYGLILAIEGLSDEEITSKVFSREFNFINTIEQQFKNRLAVSWNRNDKDVCGNWYQHAYIIRNKIVHQGYLPTRHQSYSAVKYSLDFKDSAIKSLIESKNKYSKLASFHLSLSMNNINSVAGHIINNDLRYGSQSNEFVKRFFEQAIKGLDKMS